MSSSNLNNDSVRCKYQPQIELLLGCDNGVIFCFDPVLVEKGNVAKYNSGEVKKEMKVEIVKWFEAMDEGENPNKFIVVFEDGSIYIFFREANSGSQN